MHPQDLVKGALIQRGDARWYRIDGVERLEPFLTTVVSDRDLWMFVSSAGPCTAGRIDADHALLPYETDDRLHRAVGVTGPLTLIAIGHGAGREVWEPFSRRPDPGVTRALEQHELGAALTLEAVDRGRGLGIRTTWEPAPSYGWVRTVELTDLSGAGAEVEVLDGLLDVMPAGVLAETERRASNLVDAYKRSEVGAWGSAAVFALESGITDRAEPSASLQATLVWSTGWPQAAVHLDERVLDAVWAGRDLAPVELLTGRRGCYLLRGPVQVPAGGTVRWSLVADTPLGHAALTDRIALAARPDAAELVTADVAAGRARLAGLLAAADDHQRTADEVADVHHRSNVRFNVMRGGVFVDGHHLPVADLGRFLTDRNRGVAERHAGWLAGLGERAEVARVRAAAQATGDADLIRLVLEYLPLTFSRRHGDPSRPWNRFELRVRGEDGGVRLFHEGNWRDIFQNWEALLRSFPRFLPGVVASFLDASTADGHNPYRISRDGIDWEVPDPEDPWSNIGYWGDHQLIYLLRLLEAWQAAAPGELTGLLGERWFTYADVPYRLADHAAMVADPRDTISYDRARAAAVAERVAAIGADGRLLVDRDGQLVRVTLAEKLLVPALAKLSAYVAGGGIWMNTQRPEWNDGNNALAGPGLSVVTLFHLERYLDALTELLTTSEDPVSLSRPVAGWLDAVAAALAAQAPDAAVADPVARRQLLDALGRAGAAYRDDVRAGFDAAPVALGAGRLEALLGDALAHVRASIATTRRDDGFRAAYRMVAFPDDERALVSELPLMLEGQVAALSTSVLGPAEAAELVEALFGSALYRAEVGSFLLAPVPELVSFPERNTLPASVLDEYPALAELVGPPGTAVLERDGAGALHVRGDLVNAAALAAALDAAGASEVARAAALTVYERLFRHAAFLGRSGGMHGYEGIGSVYWHMVAKLLLAVQDRAVELERTGADPEAHRRLVAAYRRIRDGLGFRKDPASWGAVPTDCYSHTPAHAGAQQPGMTGQVKEEVLTRLGELGVRLHDGRLGWGAPLLPDEELWTELDDGRRGLELTLCATPVRVVLGELEQVAVTWAGGGVDRQPGSTLTREQTAALLDRSPRVAGVEVELVAAGDVLDRPVPA